MSGSATGGFAGSELFSQAKTAFLFSLFDLNHGVIPPIDFSEEERSCDLQSMHGWNCGLQSNQVGGEGKEQEQKKEN